jgi:hypothetical protein
MIDHVKYPRTPHLPWSESADEDDIIIDTMDSFHGREVVVTEKMDGEGTTMYHDLCHARSIDSPYHESRSWVLNLWGKIRHRLDDNQRICGENMFWVHSVVYTSLPSYFLMFSFWEDNICLSWDETCEIAKALDLYMVPVLYRGLYDEKIIKSLYGDEMRDRVEGYVVRPTDSFQRIDFQSNVAKFVRKNHIQTDQHWMRSGGELNMLRVKK